ncbi:MAG: alpha/beta hydrolase [Magnetovibrionaceae bacterium]
MPFSLGPFALLGLMSLVSACAPLDALDRLVPYDGYTVRPDQGYGDHSRQVLDVYRPAEPESFSATAPVIVFFYGGSWRKGERQQYRFVGQALAEAGYTVVIPDYRLYPEVRFPAFVEDGASAVAWTARTFPDRRIILMGHSAGAHIAALIGLDRGYLDAVGLDQTRVSAVVGFAGPYAFDPQEYRSTRAVFADWSGSADDLTPIRTADQASGPALHLLHGEDDTTVYPVNTKRLVERYQSLGGEAAPYWLADVGHIGIILDFAKPFRSEEGSFALTLDILRDL